MRSLLILSIALSALNASAYEINSKIKSITCSTWGTGSGACHVFFDNPNSAGHKCSPTDGHSDHRAWIENTNSLGGKPTFQLLMTAKLSDKAITAVTLCKDQKQIIDSVTLR